jgi:hypothetical protein
LLILRAFSNENFFRFLSPGKERPLRLIFSASHHFLLLKAAIAPSDIFAVCPKPGPRNAFQAFCVETGPGSEAAHTAFAAEAS